MNVGPVEGSYSSFQQELLGSGACSSMRNQFYLTEAPYSTAVGETSLKIDFLREHQNCVWGKIAISTALRPRYQILFKL
jgi:hypothetical protein